MDQIKKKKISFPEPPFHLHYWKWLRLAVLVFIDITTIGSSFWLAFYLRFDDVKFGGYLQLFWNLLPYVIAVGIMMHFINGLYRQVWRHATFHSGLIILKSVFLGAIVSLTIAYMIGEPVPRSIFIIYFLIGSTLTVGIRFFWRSWSIFQLGMSAKVKDRCLIYGAGSGGDLLARHIAANPKFPYQLVGFIDDDPNKKRRLIHGFKILGSRSELNKICLKYKADAVIVAIPSASGKMIREILATCQEIGVKTLIMPDMADALGEDSFRPRSIDVKDLLKRSPNAVDKFRIEKQFKQKTILVTGAGGSIGSELCRQVFESNPSKILLLDSSEFALYSIDSELRDKNNKSIEIVPLLGSTTNRDLVRTILAKYRPEVVLHAAAYKHVPLVETNPIQGILNNILGTKILAECSLASGVEKFLLISSDKAVRPTSVMGATKRVCELIVQSFQQAPGKSTCFCSVRFGNVLGSSGSVIPRFINQIQQGGPITVTHPEVTRYFMLVNEAVGLVLQSVAMSEGGEIFVLDMGEPVRIAEMAQQLIDLAGKDIEIVYTGLRPGEKLYEELILEGVEQRTLHDNIFVNRTLNYDTNCIVKIDTLIEFAMSQKETESVRILHELSRTAVENVDSITDPVITTVVH